MRTRSVRRGRHRDRPDRRPHRVVPDHEQEEFLFLVRGPENRSDVLRGTLDLLILKTLTLEPMHGWGIAVQLKNRDRLFWVGLQRVWRGWLGALILVHPATVVGWHRKGFRAYWRWKSRAKGGRPRIDPSVRRLMRHMWNSNPTWGAPRIQAELHTRGRGERLNRSALSPAQAQAAIPNLAFIPGEPPGLLRCPPSHVPRALRPGGHGA